MKQNTQTKNAEPLQDKQVSSHENELQYLKNSLDYHKLKGYAIHQNYSTDRRKKIGEYFLVDDKGTSLTGEWNYEKLNHFILGYGKAFKENEKLKADLNYNIDLAKSAIKHLKQYQNKFNDAQIKYDKLKAENEKLKAAINNFIAEIPSTWHNEDNIPGVVKDAVESFKKLLK